MKEILILLNNFIVDFNNLFLHLFAFDNKIFSSDLSF